MWEYFFMFYSTVIPLPITIIILVSAVTTTITVYWVNPYSLLTLFNYLAKCFVAFFLNKTFVSNCSVLSAWELSTHSCCLVKSCLYMRLCIVSFEEGTSMWVSIMLIAVITSYVSWNKIYLHTQAVEYFFTI